MKFYCASNHVVYNTITPALSRRNTAIPVTLLKDAIKYKHISDSKKTLIPLNKIIQSTCHLTLPFWV